MWLLGWAFGKDITCGGGGTWLGAGGPGLAGNGCINGRNGGCRGWDGNPAFIIRPPCPAGWKCWEAIGTYCCGCGAGTRGRYCKKKLEANNPWVYVIQCEKVLQNSGKREALLERVWVDQNL